MKKRREKYKETEIKEDRREYMKQYLKQYRVNNKERIDAYTIINKERRSEKHECLICGHTYTYGHKSTHEKSARHQRALNSGS